MTFAPRLPLDIETAEETTDYPRTCIVCFWERGQIHEAASADEAIAHRAAAHPWLADYMQRQEAKA